MWTNWFYCPVSTPCYICGAEINTSIKINDVVYCLHKGDCYLIFRDQLVHDINTELNSYLIQVRECIQSGKSINMDQKIMISCSLLASKVIKIISNEDNALIVRAFLKRYGVTFTDLDSVGYFESLCATGKNHIFEQLATFYDISNKILKYLNVSIINNNTRAIRFIVENFLISKNDLDKLELGSLKYYSKYYSYVRENAVNTITNKIFITFVEISCFVCKKYAIPLLNLQEIIFCSHKCRDKFLADVNKWIAHSHLVYLIILDFPVNVDVQRYIMDIFIQF